MHTESGLNHRENVKYTASARDDKLEHALIHLHIHKQTEVRD